MAYRDGGAEIIDLDQYPPSFEWEGRSLFVENAHKDWKQVDSPEFMDVVLFYDNKDIITHAGLYMNDDLVLHTCRIGTVLAPLKRIDKKIAGFYRRTA